MKNDSISLDAEKYLFTTRYNRRAISFLPGGAGSTENVSIEFEKCLNWMQRLYRLEAGNFSGCLKISCERNKSRSALLVLRGQVLGCIYGEKSLPHQLVGDWAYQKILAQVISARTSLSAYAFSEELVVASSSVFQGRTFPTAPGCVAKSITESLNEFASKNSLGSIIVGHPQLGAICVLYVRGDEVIGCSSFVEEIDPENCSQLADYLERTPNCVIFASKAVTEDVELLMEMTFSLSGLKEMLVNGMNPIQDTGFFGLPQNEDGRALGSRSRIKMGVGTGSVNYGSRKTKIFSLLEDVEKKNAFKVDTLSVFS